MKVQIKTYKELSKLGEVHENKSISFNDGSSLSEEMIKFTGKIVEIIPVPIESCKPYTYRLVDECWYLTENMIESLKNRNGANS